ncbi:hypothetical protein TRICI_002651 [Trichomonascus ciferrii]|uniref:Ubiquitin-like protease family profile domain-containing protein n=1 Tax=Trichomonascus ciferrii TaxID=44093 RepID=A0A642V7M0_9ASCO|nr:hypothetical protein TRICI_002651 [Trichomonascus ciferrii]
MICSPSARPKNVYGSRTKLRFASHGYVPQNALGNSFGSRISKPQDEDLIPAKRAPQLARLNEKAPEVNRPRKRRETAPPSNAFLLKQINSTLESNKKELDRKPGTERTRPTLKDPTESSSAKRRRMDGSQPLSAQKRHIPKKRTLYVKTFRLAKFNHQEAGMSLEITWTDLERSKPRQWELTSTKAANFKCLETDIEGIRYCDSTNELLVWLKPKRVKASIGNQSGHPLYVIFGLMPSSEVVELKEDIKILDLPIRFSSIDEKDLFHQKRAMEQGSELASAAYSKPPAKFRQAQDETLSNTRPLLSSIPLKSEPPTGPAAMKSEPPTGPASVIKPESFYAKTEEPKNEQLSNIADLFTRVKDSHEKKESTNTKESHHDDESTKKVESSVDVEDEAMGASSPPTKRTTRAKNTNTASPAPEVSLAERRAAEQKKREDHEKFKEQFNFQFHDKKTVTITPDDYNRLDEGEFLNDTMVNFYLKYLKQRAGEHRSDVEKYTYVFNTFFYEKLMQKNADGTSGFENVKKWTAKIDLFQMKYIVIPINWRMHWYVVIVYNLPNSLKYAEKEEASETPVEIQVKIRSETPKKSAPEDGPIIFVLDSLRGAGTSTSVRALKDFFVAEAWDKKRIKLSRDVFRGMNPVVPQQPNFCDCGIYVLHYVERFLKNPEKFAHNMMNKSPESKKTLSELWKENDLQKKRDVLRNTLLQWMWSQRMKESKAAYTQGSSGNDKANNNDNSNNGSQTAGSSRYSTPCDTPSGDLDKLRLSEDLEKEYQSESNSKNTSNEPNRDDSDEDMVILDYQKVVRKDGKESKNWRL